MVGGMAARVRAVVSGVGGRPSFPRCVPAALRCCVCVCARVFPRPQSSSFQLPVIICSGAGKGGYRLNLSDTFLDQWRTLGCRNTLWKVLTGDMTVCADTPTDREPRREFNRPLRNQLTRHASPLS